MNVNYVDFSFKILKNPSIHIIEILGHQLFYEIFTLKKGLTINQGIFV